LDRPPLLRGFKATHYASLFVALLVLLYLDRRQWFFFDEWEFLAARGLGGQPLRLFFPHSEHWATIPILIYRGLYLVFGLRTYVPYLLVLILLHLATAHLLWRVLLRVGADGWVATALVAVFLLLGAGYENLIWAFQISFVIPTLGGVALMLLADHGDSRFGRRDLLVWLVAVIGLMSSGIGISMVALACIVALLRRGWRAALVTASLPAAIYLVWLAVIGHQGFYATHVSKSTLLLIPDFVWRGLTSTVDGTSGLVGFGAVAVVGLLVWLLLNYRLATGLAPAFAGAIGAVVFFAITGLGRASMGIDQATGSRYLYVATALLLPVTAVIVSALARRALVVQSAFVLLALFIIGHGLSSLASQAHSFAIVKQQSKQQILAGAQLIASGARTIGQHPDPLYAPDLTTTDLAVMLHDGALPAANGLTEVDRLDAMLALQVDLAATAELPASPAVSVQAGQGGFLQTIGVECSMAVSYGGLHKVILTFAQPGSVIVTFGAAETTDAYVAVPASPTSDARKLAFTSGAPMFVSVAVAPATLTLSVPPTSIEVCGANPLPGVGP
jgi:hypothetical protein